MSARHAADLMEAVQLSQQEADLYADHKYTRETVRNFNADARQALQEMQRLRAVGGSKGR